MYNQNSQTTVKMVKLSDIIRSNAQIANFAPQIAVFRTQDDHNEILVDNDRYELRLFTFYLTPSTNGQPIRSFAEYVDQHHLHDEELKISAPHNLFPVLAFSRNTDTEYIVLSLRAI